MSPAIVHAEGLLMSEERLRKAREELASLEVVSEKTVAKGVAAYRAWSGSHFNDGGYMYQLQEVSSKVVLMVLVAE